MFKVCNKCCILKDENDFYFSNSIKTKRRPTCISCHKQYHSENFEQIKQKRRKYYEENKEEIKARNRTEKRREQNRRSARKNRDKINARDRLKRKTNQSFKLRQYISSKINRALSKSGGKKYMSFLKFVPYTIIELKEHLEKQFEPWMSWNNHGSYKTTWDDNDQLTWTWSIDHIIPQSALPFSSMEDDNFKKCWALNNIRPLSAKQNLLKGAKNNN